MALGYTTIKNLSVSTLVSPTIITTLSDTKTVSGNMSLVYLFNDTLTGAIVYNLFYQLGGATVTSANTIAVGNILTNRLTFLLTKTF